MPECSPLQRYQADLQRDDFNYDAAQEAAVHQLENLFQRLVSAWEVAEQTPKFTKILKKIAGKTREPVTGLYFWGGVGRGKTYLMDTFYECLPFERKMRTHFHRFMQRVHKELASLTSEKDPLEAVAERLSLEAKVICFDEFFVSDIGDAMILAGMLDALFRRGVSLVCTSNIEPSGLYKDGLQRARFLPAIDLLNRYTEVVNVDGGVDYRLRSLEQAELYHYPLDDAATTSLQSSYDSLAMACGAHDLDMEVNGRELTAICRADDVVWFEFRELCDGPRSQNDYIELAREFHAVLVSNVPQLGVDQDDQARRFINMVDEFYDRNVKLIMSAQVPIPDLYVGTKLQFEFERTQSRLLEMQSHDYLAAAHKA